MIPLRRGWTTGACAAAAARAAYQALLTGDFPDPVTLDLPGGRPAFALARTHLTDKAATASIIKDAGDDPDVTHGAEVVCTVTLDPEAHADSLADSLAGSLTSDSPDERRVLFRAGDGVGTVTKPGLALAVGEPAINPAPRAMIRAALGQVQADLAPPQATIIVTISIPGGEALAQKTWNEGLGIKGGLSILGTTGVVIPYSCSAWIHSIHRGIDVARAAGSQEILAATGKTSLTTGCRLAPQAVPIEMGDFAGGLLKYLRRHPIPRLIVCGGFGKISKLAAGFLDLHSARSQVDRDYLARLCPAPLAAAVREATSAGHALTLAQAHGFDLAGLVAADAQQRAAGVMDHTGAVAVWIIDRQGQRIAVADPGKSAESPADSCVDSPVDSCADSCAP
ncbi:MAG: cobalt-precorrin-5B (C(1))-methyltransferase CbiD [Pseudomonadota bacterium]